MKKRTFIISLVVIVLVGILYIKNEYSPLLLKKATYGANAIKRSKEVDNLYIGSSMFIRALDIDVLDNNSSKSNFILYYSGNQPFVELIELQDLLDCGVTIHNLYVDMYGYSAAAKPSISDKSIFLDYDIKTKHKIWHSFDKKSVSKWWELYVSANNETLLCWPIMFPQLCSKFRNGGYIGTINGSEKEKFDAYSAPQISEYLNDSQVVAIQEIINICAENGICLTFIDTPKAACVYEDRNYEQVMEQYEKLLNDNGIPYFRQGKSYDFDMSNPEFFMDAVHLSSIGGTEFTNILVALEKIN